MASISRELLAPRHSKELKCNLEPVTDLSKLESTWRALQDGSEHSFFISWPWVGTWLACLPPRIKPELLTVRSPDQLIAAALLVRAISKGKLLPSRTWSLNVTGDPELDSIVVEYNDLLVRRGYEVSAWQEVVNFLSAEHLDWDEVILPGVVPEIRQHWDCQRSLRPRGWIRTSWFKDLADIRDLRKPFVDGLGRSTKTRIRSSMRFFQERHGPISVACAGSRDEAFQYFHELKGLHQQSWQSRGRRGAFSYPFLNEFHSRMLLNHFDAGFIQLFKVSAGNATVGILYNFIYNDDVLMYQSGINYALVESPNKQSPGLLLHALAIQFNADAGRRRYDFLAGDSQYKKSLSTGSNELWWGSIRRPRLKFFVEDALAGAWRRLRRNTARMP